MKLAPAEAKAVKFVLLLIALSVLARWLKRPEPLEIEAGPVPPVAEAGAISAPARAKQPAGPIDPNIGSLRDLDRLPGIGEATARKIIAKRPYQTLDDLARVVGKKRAENLAEHLTLRPGASSQPQIEITPSSPSSPRRRSYGASERPGSSASEPQSAPATMVSLNRATPAELETIPGIGPALAKRLIAARDSLGRFRDWSQVDAVSGVGPSLLARLKASAHLY